MREFHMQCVANDIETMIHQYGGNKEQRRRIVITYQVLTHESIARFTDFQRRYHGLLPGEEVFTIWDEVDENAPDLLYVVNVTGDSILTAGCELMTLVAKKF